MFRSGVATAASMDGYTAYGASITKDGSKQTFDCPAPRAVVADIDVIRAAPPELTAGDAYRFSVYHIMDVDALEPLFPVSVETVGG